MLHIHSSLLVVCAAFLGIAGAAVAAETSGAAQTNPAVTATAPVPQTATRSHRLVYSCLDGQVPTFSDRPCGGTSLLRSLDVYTPEQSGRPPTTAAEPAKAATRPATVRDSRVRTPQDATEKCEHLQKNLDEVDDRMRAGYPARQAAQLWQRWRDARAAVREAGC